MIKSRVFMFTASSIWVALIFVVLVARGGGAVPAPVEPRSTPSALSVTHQAEALAARGDYEGAWRLYYRALEIAPEEVFLWYGLGVTLSHLDQQKEAEVAFQYVVRHGRPDSEEVRVARWWLVSAGVLAAPVTFSIAADPGEGTQGQAAVKGTVTWGGPASGQPPVPVQLQLAGLNGLAEGKRFKTRINLGETYRFDRLAEGSYRLIGAAGGQRLWDQSLLVEDGKEISLDLGKDNSQSPTVELSR